MHTQKYWIFQNWKKIIHINLFLLSFLLNFLTFVTCLWHFFLGQFHVFLRKCHTFYSYIFYKFSIIDLRNILEDEIDVEWFNASKKSFSLKTIEVEFGNRTELYQIFNNGMVERVKSIPSSLCGDLVCHSWWTHYAREQRYCYIPISMLNEFNPDVCVSNQKNISSHREGPPSD